MLTKKIKKLIDDAAKLDAEVKEKTALLKADKEALTDWWFPDGKNLGKKFEGDVGKVAFSETDVFDAIPPRALKTALTNAGKADRFIDCVKVDAAALKGGPWC